VTWIGTHRLGERHPPLRPMGHHHQLHGLEPDRPDPFADTYLRPHHRVWKATSW